MHRNVDVPMQLNLMLYETHSGQFEFYLPKIGQNSNFN